MTERAPHWPLLCLPEEKAQREANNAVEQIDYITSLVVGARRVMQLRESHILQLQQLAVEGIYPCGGTYRDARDDVRISDSDHKPAHAAHVRNLVTELVEWVNRERANGRHEIECASYALWRLNWIHPFRGGNGRTSRMIAYLIISMGLGHMIPGTPTIPAQIYEQREQYVEALRAVDAHLRRQLEEGVEDPAPDLSPMISFLRPMIEFQMERGVTDAEHFERMLVALATGTGRVEIDLESPAVMGGAHDLPLFEELDDRRRAPIASGTRVARLFLHENEPGRRLDPKRHDGEARVSLEQTLTLLGAGATWVGPNAWRPPGPG